MCFRTAPIVFLLTVYSFIYKVRVGILDVMKEQAKKQTKSEGDVTLADFFKLVEEVAKKAKTDPASKKLIDSAAQKWQSDSGYII